MSNQFYLIDRGVNSSDQPEVVKRGTYRACINWLLGAQGNWAVLLELKSRRPAEASLNLAGHWYDIVRG